MDTSPPPLFFQGGECRVRILPTLLFCSTVGDANIVICERCGKEHLGTFGSGRFCSRACANARVLSKDIRDKIKLSMKRYCINNGYIERKCKVCGKTIKTSNKSGFCSECLKHSDEGKEFLHTTLSIATKGKCGGRRNGSGTGKKGIYKGYHVDSTWELAYIIYNLENGVQFERNDTTFFEYDYENKKHKYYPDFIEGDTFVEIKGWMSERAKIKIAAIPDTYKIKVLGSKEILPYLEYVISKYGENFFDVLCEKKGPIDKCRCIYCGVLFKDSPQRRGHQGRCKKNPKYHFWSSNKKSW